MDRVSKAVDTVQRKEEEVCTMASKEERTRYRNRTNRQISTFGSGFRSSEQI